MKPKAFCLANPHRFKWMDDLCAPGNGWITCVVNTHGMTDTKHQSEVLRRLQASEAAKSRRVSFRSHRKRTHVDEKFLPLFEVPQLRTPYRIVHNDGYQPRMSSRPRTFVNANRMHNKRHTVEESKMYAFMMAASEKKGAAFKLAKFPEDSNARNWATQLVEPMARSHSQAMANVIATESEFTLDEDEMLDLFSLLKAPNKECEVPEEDHSPVNVYDRIKTHASEASRAYMRDEVRGRIRKYREANSMLHGLIEIACAHNAEVHCFIKAKITGYTPEELQHLKGNVLLKEIVTKFHRDTPASLSLKLSEFHSMTLSHKYRNAHTFLVALEEAGAELVRLGGIDSDKLSELLTSRLIAGIRRRYEALAHSIELKRSEIDGISWEAVKALVRRIDIDAISTESSLPFREKRGRESDSFSPHQRNRHSKSRLRDQSPYKKEMTCNFCGKIGHDEAVCRSKLAAQSPKPSTFTSPQERNSALKAVKSKFDRRTHRPHGTSPNRIRCRNCGGNHFASQCKVSLSEVRHAKEMSLPDGYYIPEDLQGVQAKTDTTHNLFMFVHPYGSKYPHHQADGSPTTKATMRLNQAQETLASLTMEVEVKDISVEQSLDECDFLVARTCELRVMVRNLPTSNTTQLQRRSNLETAVNRVYEETLDLKDHIIAAISDESPNLGYEHGSVGCSSFTDVPNDDLVMAGIIPSNSISAPDASPEKPRKIKLPKSKLSQYSTPDVKRARIPEG